MVIRFRPGHLGTKPDTLTCCPDLYPSGGKGDYGKVNPHNLKPIFSFEQLSASLQATSLLPAVLHGIIAMDLTQLNMEILSALDTGLTAKSYLTDTNDPKYKNWSKDELGYVCINGHIFVLESGPFQLRVLQYHHDHPVSGHFSINKTLALIHRDYIWPNFCSSVTDYCRSCTTCSCSKSKRHKPYRLLQQLPVPVRPWDSISMDFIEQLPTSSDGFTAILVVVDRFTKQSIFIPTHDTITSAQLAELFVIHVFSKHGVPCHVTSNRGSEFVSHFFRSLGKALDMKLHFTSGYHLEGDGQTKRVNQTLEQYLHMYSNYQQDNWSSLLPLAEFAYNNAPNATTGVTPFFANKGYDPAITLHPEYNLLLRL